MRFFCEAGFSGVGINFLTTKNIKLIILQFKINHNIIYTKDKLKKYLITYVIFVKEKNIQSNT